MEFILDLWIYLGITLLIFMPVIMYAILASIIISLISLIKAKGISKTCKVLIIIIILLVIFIIFINIYHERSNDIYREILRINNNKSLIGLTKEEVVERLGKPKDEFNNEKAKGYKYDAGYVSKEISFGGHTYWLKTYYYEFIVYFDETDKVESTLRREPLRLGG